MRMLVIAIVAAVATMASVAPPTSAKVPGATHCYNDICHRVLSIAETEARIGQVDLVLASHYGAPGRDPNNPRLETSSGEIFKPDRDDNIASPIFPDGTRLLLWNPTTGHAVSVRVNNAGPYSRGRLIDTSEHVARKLGFYHQGVARIYAVVIAAPTAVEANYKRGRTYPGVPGYLGRFEHLKHAMLADNAGLTALMRPGVHDDRIAVLAVAQSPETAPPKTLELADARLVLASRTVAPPRASVPVKLAVVTQPPAARRASSILRPRRILADQAAPAGPLRPDRKAATTRCVFDNSPACS